MANQEYTYPWYARAIHMAMAGFGIAAYLTAELAEGGVGSTGYLLHAYLGLSLMTSVLLRVIRGFAGPGPLRFAGWSPFSRRQWAMALQDLRSAARFRVPERGMHEGIAGLVQASGIAIFVWMGTTGTLLYLLGGSAQQGLFENVEELHEIGEALIPLYLVLHVGSVVLHSLTGNPIWRRMWTFGAAEHPRQASDPT